MEDAALKRLRERAPHDYDIRDMLAKIDRLTAESARLQKTLTERRPIAEVDPTGGSDPKFNWGNDP
jgi:hypothetical protein